MDEIIYVSSNLHKLIFRCWMNYCKLFTGPNQRGLRNFLRLLPDSLWTFRTSAGRRLHGRCQGPRLHVRCRYDHYCTKFLLADRGVAKPSNIRESNLAGGQMTLRQRNNFLFYSFQQLPCLCLGTLKGFWADTAPCKCPQLASCIASRTTEKQGDCRVCRGPRIPLRTIDANLDFAFVEKALVFIAVQNIGGPPPKQPTGKNIF